MNMLRPNNIILLLAITVCLLAGCVSKHNQPETQQISNFAQYSCRAAVLPFTNSTSYPNGHTFVYRIFVAELNKQSDFNISLEGDVQKAYRQMRLGPKKQPSLEQMKIIADRLDVPLLIKGSIITLNEKRSSDGNNPDIALNIQLIDAKSGKILLDTYHHRQGEDYRKVLHFGKVNTLTQLTKLTASEIITGWQSNGFGQCQKN